MSKKFLITTISIASVLLLCFLGLAVAVVLNEKMPFSVDTNIANWAYSIRGEKGGFTYWFFRIITELGYTYFVVALLLVVGIITKFKPKVWFMAIPVAVAWLLHKIIKAIILRPRPDSDLWWAVETSTSFPSGHSNTVACLFVLIIYFVITSPTIKLWAKYLISSLSVFAILLVPLSRIILGVHFFTDVIAGLILGSLCAVLGIIAYNIFVNLSAKKKQNTNENQIDKHEPTEQTNTKTTN